MTVKNGAIKYCNDCNHEAITGRYEPCYSCISANKSEHSAKLENKYGCDKEVVCMQTMLDALNKYVGDDLQVRVRVVEWLVAKVIKKPAAWGKLL